jgi:undecaprenyl diphosphate synthase
MTAHADQRAVAAAPQEFGGAPLRHVAIIMDGNGRWAADRGLPRSEGHRRGVEAVRRTVSGALELGIAYLTLYSFSSENWSRPRDEVDFLFGLLRLFIRRDLADLHRNGVRVTVIGERATLPADIQSLIEEAEALTAGNRRLDLFVAFNYGSRDELTRVMRRLAEEVRAGRLAPEAIDQNAVAARLDTAAIPDPDLILRTGGEVRLSNFLLWQAAYAELIFTQDYWPDFGIEQLKAAVAEFGRRTRRYGGLAASAGA